MAVTYEPIASTTLGSAAIEIVFADIPGTYTDLVLICQGKSANTGSSTNALRVRFNDDSGSNYSSTLLIGNGSTASSVRTSSETYMDVLDLAQTSASIAVNRFQIMSYANTNVFKTALGFTAAPSVRVLLGVGLWRSTSAITSLKVYRDGTINLESGFTAALYGIKAA